MEWFESFSKEWLESFSIEWFEIFSIEWFEIFSIEWFEIFSIEWFESLITEIVQSSTYRNKKKLKVEIFFLIICLRESVYEEVVGSMIGRSFFLDGRELLERGRSDDLQNFICFILTSFYGKMQGCNLKHNLITFKRFFSFFLLPCKCPNTKYNKKIIIIITWTEQLKVTLFWLQSK